ncbi:MAG: glycosyltransferase family 39 protein [bacterium]
MNLRANARDPLLWIILCIGSFFNFAFLDWGTPNAERNFLVFDGEQRIQDLSASMVQAREELYEWIENPDAIRAAATRVSEKPPVEMFPSTADRPVEEVSSGMLNSLRSYLLRSSDPDEQQTLSGLANMDPVHGDLDPNEYRYGGGFYYGLAAILGVGMLSGLLHLSAQLDRYFLHPDELAGIFTACRFLGAAASVLTGLVLYGWARRRWGRDIGFIAGILFCVCPAVITYSHISKPNIFSTLLGLLAVVVLNQALGHGSPSDSQRPSIKRVLLIGVLFGLGIGTFLTSGIVMVFALMWGWIAAGSARNRLIRMLPYLIPGVLLGFLLSNPFMIISWEHVGDLYFECVSGSGWGYGIPGLSKLLTAVIDVPPYFGYVVSVGAAIGLVMGLFRRDAFSLACLLSFAVVGLLMGSARFAICLIPFLCILAAIGLQSLVQSTGVKFVRIIIIILAVVVVAFQAVQVSSAFAMDSGRRNAIGRWINQTIPAGAAVGQIGQKPVIWRTPPFAFERYRLVVFYEFDMRYLEEYRPDWIVHQFGRIRESDAEQSLVFSVLKESDYDLVQIFDSPRLLGCVPARNPAYTSACPVVSVWKRSDETEPPDSL